MDISESSGPSGTRKIAPDAPLSSRRISSSEDSGSRPAPEARQSLIRDLWELTKPEISFLVTLSALAGFLLASRTGLDLAALIYTVLATALTSGGSGVLNHYREWTIDAKMRRTQNRPLPAGRINPTSAALFGGCLVLSGLALLVIFINLLTAVLALTTVVLYLALYTPLKRVTTYNTLIGCFPGALPALGGWTAATGSFGLGGWLLFGMLFTWQMPHFLALAWMYRTDYERGGFQMLPVVDRSGDSTAYQTLLFTGLLVLLSILPTVFHLTGWTYTIGVLVLGGYFLVPSIRFLYERTNRVAKQILKASIVYVPALVGLIILDRFIL